MTQYSYDARNARSGGTAIIPLTADEAKEWLEERKETDAL